MKTKIRLSHLICAAVLLVGCGSPKPVDLVGLYTFSLNEIHEHMELNSNGTFKQQITIGAKNFDTTGTWSIEGPRAVVFQGSFLVRCDEISGETIDPPKEYSFFKGYWHSGSARIVFDDEGKYFLERNPPAEISTH